MDTNGPELYKIHHKKWSIRDGSCIDSDIEAHSLYIRAENRRPSFGSCSIDIMCGGGGGGGVRSDDAAALCPLAGMRGSEARGQTQAIQKVLR